MIALLLTPVYILVMLYLLRWNIWWLIACSPFFKRKGFRIGYSCFFLALSLSPLFSFLITEPSLKWFFKHLSNYWLGTLLYILMIILLGDLIRFILLRCSRVNKVKLHSRKTFVITGAVVLFCILSVSLYGIVHARTLKLREYTITVDKDCEAGDLRVVLIADLHIGYNIGHRYIERMTERINALEPDLICIAGDIFDNEYEALDDPEAIREALSGLESTYGVYACWGNHDISERILAGFTFGGGGLDDDPRMGELLEEAGIVLLNDETVCVDGAFYLSGRKDLTRAEKLEGGRETPEELLESLDKELPILVMDHQPRELSELSLAGADLQLSGHTHNGQLFPGNLLVALLYDNAYGLKKEGKMYSVVTSGVGVWGPGMRVGTDSEIVLINLEFNGKDT